MNNSSDSSEDKGVVIQVKNTQKETVNDFLKKAMEQGVFDAVLISMKVPAGDSFAYVLLTDKELLKDTFPLPPIMSVQGAKAISSITRRGKGNKKIAAIMRPCEIRATVELTKLGQIDLDNIVLISMDCFGVMPTPSFIKDPEKSLKKFEDAIRIEDDTVMRPVCRICDKSSMVAGDLHIGTRGVQKDAFFIVSNTKKGKDILDKLGLISNKNIDTWLAKVKENAKEKQKKRKQAHKDLQSSIKNLDKFLDTFSHCINCHNCMRACPICCCRVCYFDSDKMKHPSDDYLRIAKSKGSIRFLPDTTIFHIGRMVHMSLSCVSCGSCEDACPMSIPVAQLFSMTADETQGLFDYIAGKSLEEPLPLTTFIKEELSEVEDVHD